MSQLGNPLRKKPIHKPMRWCDKVRLQLKFKYKKDSLNLFSNVLKARPANKWESKNENICSSVTQWSKPIVIFLTCNIMLNTKKIYTTRLIIGLSEKASMSKIWKWTQNQNNFVANRSVLRFNFLNYLISSKTERNKVKSNNSLIVFTSSIPETKIDSFAID